jgi:iron(III) transport system ATP-binding protein
VMQDGLIIQVGTAEHLYHHPAQLFVARLFSEINEIRYRVQSGSIDTPVGPIPAPGFADGTAAILCLRERSLVVRPQGQSERRGRTGSVRVLAGRVQHVRFLGDVGLVEVAVEGFEGPLKIRTTAPEGLRRGANVDVEIDPTRAFVFPANAADPATGSETPFRE